MINSAHQRAPFIDTLWLALTTKLDGLKHETNHLQHAQKGLQIVTDIYNRLKKEMVNYVFKNSNEEIDFFKNVKPMFLKYYLFYNDAYRIQLHEPAGTDADKKLFFEQELK